MSLPRESGRNNDNVPSNIDTAPILSKARNASSSANSVTSNGSFGAVSAASTSYSHHRGAAIVPHTPLESPKSKLMIDSTHKPKTMGSVGLLVVGVGGANGTTLLAGVLANRLGMEWRGPRGEPMDPNYNGCITQLSEKGVHGGVGFKDKVTGLADANMAAIGGWDIRPTKLGDALLDAQILDYDLVRQVQNEMNKVKIFRGLYDPRFIGSSQHETATYTMSEMEAPDASEALKCLRADIRYFKWKNGVVGHTTVIWSASVEPDCELLPTIETAGELLNTIELTDQERGGPLPPSLLYATAALLEGCSFVNGGSQNTLACEGLNDLSRQQLGAYCLGTDFKAGQTKFKTAAVEYIRTMGLTPKVIASSNHLGNNDMKNLSTSNSDVAKAKLRVKHNIFEAWEEDIDHKVSIMYTPYVNDEKRDFVEYTSLGFLGQPHTMVTYTRASDSVLCVPLMIDAAIWCDFFSHNSWPFDKVAKALAYLFKVPEGGAIGVDPGFFRQMQELESQAKAACEPRTAKKSRNSVKRVRIRPEEKLTEWALPHDSQVICGGLACVDMQLYEATGGDGGESIETFEGEKSIGGGSVSMACKTLARLCHGAPLGDSFMQVTPPVIHGVVPLCKVGQDDSGNKLLSLLEKCGGECRNVETKYIKAARRRDPNARTALAVLPIYKDGRRGCYFDAASNATFTHWEMIELIQNLMAPIKGPSLDVSAMSEDDFEIYHERTVDSTPIFGAFLFGYPHLLPNMQGDALAEIFHEARAVMDDGGIVVLDLNGVPEGKFKRTPGSLRTASDLQNDPVIGAALENVDILHMNEDELALLTGCEIEGVPGSQLEDEFAIASAANLFLLCGVAIVAVTRGEKGSFISCNDEARFRRSPVLPPSWVDCTAKIDAVELPPDTLINTNGAGDAFISGLLVAAMLRHTGMSVPRKDSGKDQSEWNASSAEAFSPETISPTKTTPKAQLSPYTVYMRENYVLLKQQLNDDKKAIFSKCHEMWEDEPQDVKAMFERRAIDDAEVEEQAADALMRLETSLVVLDSTPRSGASFSDDDGDEMIRNLYMTNRALNLESAVQFASLVAAHHVDVSTRDLLHLDMFRLLDRAMIFPHGLEEI